MIKINKVYRRIKHINRKDFNDMEDWRLQGQEKYLQGKTFIFKRIFVKGHDHCEFCWETFYQNEDKNAYTTLDGHHIVCETCFNDFKEEFQFRIFSKDDFRNKKTSEIIKQEINEITTNSMTFVAENVEKLAELLKDVPSLQENLLLTPAIGTFAIRRKTTIELLDTNIHIQNMIDLLNTIKEIKKNDYNLFSNNKTGTHQKLCIQLKTV